MLQIHPVLHQLDDAKEQFGVSQPAKHILKSREILILHSACDTMTERGQHHDRHIGIIMLDGACYVKHAVVLCCRHTDDQIYLLCGHMHLGIPLACHLYESGWEAKAQTCIFRKDLFIHSPIILQDECVIGIGHDEHIADALKHQVNK